MALAKEIADVLEMFVLAGLKGNLFDAQLAKQLWAETDADVLQCAALEYIKTAKFMPTFAELTPFIESELQRREWLRQANEDAPNLSAEEIFEIALVQLVYREPVCAKCAGGSYLTNNERELSVRAFQDLYRRLPNKEEIKPCDGDCICGHQKPSQPVIAQLRAEILNNHNPQPKPKKRKA